MKTQSIKLFLFLVYFLNQFWHRQVQVELMLKLKEIRILLRLQ